MDKQDIVRHLRRVHGRIADELNRIYRKRSLTKDEIQQAAKQPNEELAALFAAMTLLKPPSHAVTQPPKATLGPSHAFVPPMYEQYNNPNFTWLTLDRDNAVKLSSHLAKTNKFFIHCKLSDNEHTIILSSMVDLTKDIRDRVKGIEFTLFE